MSEWFNKCKPAPWQPPAIVFRIVWPILYTLYAIVLFLERKNSNTFSILLVGLLLNLCWVPLFIYSTQLALLLLIAMILVGIKSIYLLYLSNYTRALLFTPYMLWLGVAFSLNAYIALTCKS